MHMWWPSPAKEKKAINCSRPTTNSVIGTVLYWAMIYGDKGDRLSEILSINSELSAFMKIKQGHIELSQ